MLPSRRPTALRSDRRRSPLDWLLDAALLAAVLIAAGILLAASTITLLGYLLPLPSLPLQLAARAAAGLVGVGCVGALLAIGRAVRADSQARYAGTRRSPAEEIPLVGVLAEPARRLLLPLAPGGGLTAGHRR